MFVPNLKKIEYPERSVFTKNVRGKTSKQKKQLKARFTLCLSAIKGWLHATLCEIHQTVEVCHAK